MSDYTTIRETYEVDTVSRTLAPEDIRAGMYIAVLNERKTTWPWFLTAEDIFYDRVKPFVCSVIPTEGGKPLRVIEVCLPFVLIENERGQTKTLDVRTSSLVQMSDRYGRESFRRATESRERKRAQRKEDAKE